MQILLSCAKLMREASPRSIDNVSQPRFESEAKLMGAEMAAKSSEELAQLFDCSVAVAAKTLLRYHQFLPYEPLYPAIFGYTGQAYRCLDAMSIADSDLHWANDHLWITSFLYGLLRPLDNIRPYRMEGRLRLEAAGGQSLFDYWKDHLTDLLIESVKADDGILVHLATQEMERLFHWQKVKEAVRIVQPQFYVRKKGKLANVTVYAKSCRGAMTRDIITRHITSPEALNAFEYEGFSLSAADSSVDNPVFVL